MLSAYTYAQVPSDDAFMQQALLMCRRVKLQKFFLVIVPILMAHDSVVEEYDSNEEGFSSAGF